MPVVRHLMEAWRQRKRKPDRLNVPTLPGQTAHVWSWWQDVRGGMADGEHGITWADLDAWIRVTGIRPTLAEISLMMDIDTEYRAQRREWSRSRSE